MIPYGRQKIGDKDVEAVSLALKESIITRGPRVAQFEREVASYCGAKYGIAVCNGTVALHLAMLSLKLGSGDGVIVPSLTFLASANCVEYVGACPYFADIDPHTYNVDLNQVEDLLKREKSIKAIIGVDFAGLPADWKGLRLLADRFGVALVEDACHALGSDYRDGEQWRKIGDARLSDISIFSFHPVKHITTGEGGLLLTNDGSLADRMRTLRMHGMQRPESESRPWYYEMEELGYNFCITDFQCALGSSQLEHLDVWVEKRRTIAGWYDEFFQQTPQVLTPAAETPYGKSSFHLYVIQVERRDEVYLHLRENGIAAQVHYFPVHLQPYYKKKYGTKVGDLPTTELYSERCLSLPCFVDLKKGESQRVVDLIVSFLGS